MMNVGFRDWAVTVLGQDFGTRVADAYAEALARDFDATLFYGTTQPIQENPMTDDYEGPKPMPRPEIPPRCPTCGLPMWPAAEYGPHLCPPGFQDLSAPVTGDGTGEALPDLEDLTPAERIGVAVAAMVEPLVAQREYAQTLATNLEGENAEALKHLRAVVAAWPASTWAQDTQALDQANEFLGAVGSPETPEDQETDR